MRGKPKDKLAIQCCPHDSRQASQTLISSREVIPATCHWAKRFSFLLSNSESLALGGPRRPVSGYKELEGEDPRQLTTRFGSSSAVCGRG